jgi:aconitate hydratase
MLPLLIDDGELPFANGDYIFLPNIQNEVREKAEVIEAYTVKADGLVKFSMKLGDLTDDEREIIEDGCLINYYRSHKTN